ncbi:MAG: hypothetical protein G01um101449_253 [Parcubacteria group bacterium Gr01-1014_49]|nr:MAG: hypothetical protein G01um101449_253 [Parcubacteria group bacterium Gr01-1014_49]
MRSLQQQVEKFLRNNPPLVGWEKFPEEGSVNGSTRLLTIKKDKDPIREESRLVLVLRANEVSKDGVFKTLSERLKEVLQQHGFSKVPATWTIEYQASARKEFCVGASS